MERQGEGAGGDGGGGQVREVSLEERECEEFVLELLDGCNDFGAWWETLRNINSMISRDEWPRPRPRSRHWSMKCGSHLSCDEYLS